MIEVVPGTISNNGQLDSTQNMVVWTIPSLGAGQSIRVQVTYLIPLTSTATSFENTAYVNYDNNDQGNIGSNNVQAGTQNPFYQESTPQNSYTSGNTSSPSRTTSVSSSSPKTGVDSFLVIWLILFIGAVLLLSYQIIKQRKQQNKTTL